MFLYVKLTNSPSPYMYICSIIRMGLKVKLNTPQKPKTKTDYCKDEHRSSHGHPDTSPDSAVALVRTFCVVLFFSLLDTHQLPLFGRES